MTTAVVTATETGRRLFRIPQALQRLPVGRSKFYELLNSGRLKSVKIDGCRLIDERELNRFIDSLGEGGVGPGNGL